MPFYEEPYFFQKTIISDLQGAWMLLREAVVEAFPFPESERLLFHVDEAMSWESVRDLEKMKKTLLLIRNIANQNQAPERIMICLKEVRVIFEEVMESIAEGEIL